jgi:hypothetical protein
MADTYKVSKAKAGSQKGNSDFFFLPLAVPLILWATYANSIRWEGEMEIDYGTQSIGEDYAIRS